MITIPKNDLLIRFYLSYRNSSGQSMNRSILSLILIISIICSSVTSIYFIVTPTGEKFTEFYIFGPNGTASNYPTDLKIGEEGDLIIIIINHEHENVNYRLEINFNGSLIHEENVFLAQNEKCESPFTFKAIRNESNQKLEILLYKDQQIEAYRTLHLWINVK